MPEITTITSESLQAEVRRLLPSQRGFGQDLEAQNVIVPIVDLTPTAEGSALREDLQTAYSFDAISTATRFNSPGTTVLVDTPGFWKYSTIMSLLTDTTASSRIVQMFLQKGGSTNALHQLANSADSSGENPQQVLVEGVVFLESGASLQINSSGVDTFIRSIAIPIADVNGNLINPANFSFE
jgi:hypothetical protein